jgi:hypothetical protein
MCQSVHNGRCAMWRMTDLQAVAFLAIVAILTALALLA